MIIIIIIYAKYELIHITIVGSNFDDMLIRYERHLAHNVELLKRVPDIARNKTNVGFVNRIIYTESVMSQTLGTFRPRYNYQFG